MANLSDRYNPKDFEEKIYAYWMSKNFFKAQDKSVQPPFCIVIPPPNVTGQLHIGHALNHTLQDVLIRWKRMSGHNAAWIPGTDHAGIATQSVVEKQLQKDSQPSRREMGREAFVKKVWEWKADYGDRIVHQMKRLGNSCDWNRFAFTLDENLSQAVRKVFVDLYKKGLLYRGQKLINWSPQLESAISDLEVDFKEIKGHLYHIRYFLESPSRSTSVDHLVVATTRPETLLGDVALAVHPEDERYRHLIGQAVKLPLTTRSIPIIADEFVDKTFGSGVVKVTPAHDFNDYEVGLRHKLAMINILNPNGTLNSKAGAYQGLKVQEARKRVLADLQTQGLLVREEAYTHQVGHCSRTGCVAEPFLSEQWFMKMQTLAGPAISVVENGTVVFEPESWTKTYLHWMRNIKDWCISRQLWWGHRIPVWYCKDCQHMTVSETDPTHCEKCKSKNIRQDEDVLDTWFSSALWPFSTMGWPQSTEALKTFYPTNVLITGHDIIFFWVARMIMMGLEFMKDVPFRKVVITGLVRNEQGQKMSKSLGNALDPLEIIDQYGADALRYTLVALVASGRDLKFSLPRLEGYRNFMNKVWNAARFSLSALEGYAAPLEGDHAQPKDTSVLSDADQWIIYKLGECEKSVHDHLTQLRFADAALVIYDFVWHQFCDWYLELIKPIIYGSDSAEKTATQLVLAQTLNRVIRLLHPFAPFITEEIYQKLPIKNQACITDVYPHPRVDKNWLQWGNAQKAKELDLVIDVISAIRQIRGENRIKPSDKIKVRLSPQEAEAQKILQQNKSSIMNLGRLESCEISQEGSLSKCALTPLKRESLAVDVIVYLEGLVDINEEKKRLEKLIDKSLKEAQSLQGRLNDEEFVKNAPEQVVEEGRKTLIDLQSKVKTLQESLARLN